MVPTPAIDGLCAVVAAFEHDGEAAAAVRALKYGRSTVVVAELADALAPLAPRAGAVTWVPSTKRHRRRRGFDPSELLARAVGRRIGRPAVRLLRRCDSVAQTERDRIGRRAGPDLRTVARLGPYPSSVLLVDDVCTTGSTLRAAAAVLRARGVISVAAAVATTVRSDQVV